MSFETLLSEDYTRDNYFYLDLLDKSRKSFPTHFNKISQQVLDVGSKNFYYAETLRAFFKPSSLVGLEVDGYTVYRDGHSRKDYAEYYIKNFPEAQYVIEDVFSYEKKADIITCLYPFVFPETAVNWSMPLAFFKPEKFFLKIESLLKDGGYFWMLNHGEEEWEEARKLLARTNLKLIGDFTEHNPLSSCDTAACVSLWKA